MRKFIQKGSFAGPFCGPWLASSQGDEKLLAGNRTIKPRNSKKGIESITPYIIYG